MRRRKQMSEHTPGPWMVNKYGGVGAGEFGTNPCVIQSDGFIGEDREEADKALISAAPDLLAACEAVVDDLSDEERANMGDLYDLVCAAIAKARGQG
jgi:hypothetical protein